MEIDSFSERGFDVMSENKQSKGFRITKNQYYQIVAGVFIALNIILIIYSILNKLQIDKAFLLFFDLYAAMLLFLTISQLFIIVYFSDKEEPDKTFEIEKGTTVVMQNHDNPLDGRRR